LIAIAERVVFDGGDRLVAGAAEQVLREPFEKFYGSEASMAAGDVVRGIDTLGNARLVCTGDRRRAASSPKRLVSEFGLADADLSDASVGADIGTGAFEVLTADDLAREIAAPPRGFGG
jgi:hypothetical protein